MRRVLNTPCSSYRQFFCLSRRTVGLVIHAAICSMAEGIDRWERVTGPFPPSVWKRPADGFVMEGAASGARLVSQWRAPSIWRSVAAMLSLGQLEPQTGDRKSSSPPFLPPIGIAPSRCEGNSEFGRKGYRLPNALIDS